MAELLRQLQSLGDFQRRLLPRFVPQPEGWRIAVSYSVGRWPGGDYYDFVTLPDGRVLLFLAGANDRGPTAVALVGMVKVLLHSCPLSSGVERLPFCAVREPVLQPPHILLGHLNRVLFENSLEEQFLTAFCAVLEPVGATFHHASAGRPAPLWRRAATGAVEALPIVSGLPLGANRQASYHERRIEIDRGDVLAFFSAGLISARDWRGQSFGLERLSDALREAGGEVGDAADAVRDAVAGRLEEFLQGKEPFDDISLLVIARQA